MKGLIVFITLVSLVFLAPWIAARIAERSPLDPPRRSGWFWNTALLAFLGLIFGLGGLTVPAFILGWLIVWAVRLFPRWIASVPVCLAIAVLAGHISGHRLYGSPRITDSRSLQQNALEVARLEAPNVVVCTDGTRHPIAGIAFRPDILALSDEDQCRAMDRRGQPWRFLPDPARPSGYTVEHRSDYCCGNSFFPSFLPRDLPSHRKDDLGLALLRLGTADGVAVE